MEFRQLRYFLAIARYGTFRAAADVLFVAQPALSTQIQKLEQELGCVLFLRSQRGVVLTGAGLRFASYAQNIADQMDAAKSAMTSMAGPTTRVRVGIPPLASKTLSLSLLSRARDEIPLVNLEIQELMTGVLRDRLSSGAIEIALLNSRLPREFPQAKCLKSEAIYVGAFGEIGLALKKKKKLSVGDLPGISLVMSTRRNCHREIVERLAKEHGCKLSIAAEVDSPSRMSELVKNGSCAMIGPRGNFTERAQKGCVIVPLVGGENAWETNIVIASGHRKDPAVIAVAGLIEKIVLGSS